MVLNWHQFSFDLYFVDTVHIDSQFLFLVNFFTCSLYCQHGLPMKNFTVFLRVFQWTSSP